MTKYLGRTKHCRSHADCDKAQDNQFKERGAREKQILKLKYKTMTSKIYKHVLRISSNRQSSRYINISAKYGTQFQGHATVPSFRSVKHWYQVSQHDFYLIMHAQKVTTLVMIASFILMVHICSICDTVFCSTRLWWEVWDRHEQSLE